jgi:DNA modification methylase
MEAYSLFGNNEVENDTSEKEHLTIMPVSVIDIEKQEKRKNENHNKSSSRANYSPFPNEVSTLCYEFFLKNTSLVFDPFAGWGERHAKAKEYGINYYGIDISNTAIEKAREVYGVENYLGNSLKDDIPVFDGLLTCPPYWNLEKYDNENGIDRCKSWEEFINLYEEVIKRCYEKAELGATFCIMVGNWRSKGVYYDLQFETDRILKKLGMVTIDKIVVSRKKVSKIKIMLPQAKRLGYSVNVHEHLLVYKKIK